MGKKDGELWDDSALIDAFEDAISSYKMMHGMKQVDGLKDESEAGDNAQEEIADEDSSSHVEMITPSEAVASYSVAEAMSPTKEKEVGEDVSNVILEQEAVEGYLQVQPVADYNSLVNQYYELQEKLQITWQQLQLFGCPSDQFPSEAGLPDGAAKEKASGLSSNETHADIITTLVNQKNDLVGTKSELCLQLLPCGCPNNQYPNSAGVQGAYSIFQEQSIIDSGSQPTAVCCCCPCPCMNKCMVYAPCPASVCKLCQNAVPGFGLEMSSTLEDNDPIKVAMRAAEKAISSIKIQISDEQEGSGKISTDSKVISSKDDGCETDISTVLSAWFSAGLATGKYLAEQSNARRKKGQA